MQRFEELRLAIKRAEERLKADDDGQFWNGEEIPFIPYRRITQTRIVADTPWATVSEISLEGIIAPMALKEFKHLLDETPGNGAVRSSLLELQAGNITMGMDVRIGENPFLACPHAYTFDERTGRFGTIAPLFMTDVYGYLRALKAHDVPETRIGAAVTDILFRTCCGMAQLHSAGRVHRDLKPANVLINFDEDLAITRLGISDFDYLGKTGDRHMLMDRAGSIGTKRYMARTLLLGTDQDNHRVSASPMLWDGVPYGWMMRELAFDEHWDHPSREELIERREALRAGARWKEIAKRRGLERLHPLSVYLTDEHRGPRDMDEIIELLNIIRSGRKVRDLRVREAMRYRKGVAAARTQGIMRNAGIAAASAALIILGSIPGYELWRGQSLERCARAASTLEPAAVARFDTAAHRQFLDDLALAERKGDQDDDVFIYGSFSKVGGDPVFLNGYNDTSRHFLGRMIAEISFAPAQERVRLAKKYAAYAVRQEISLGYDRTTDQLNHSIARFMTNLDAIPWLRRRFPGQFSPDEERSLSIALERSIDAATIALRHFHRESSTFQGDRPVSPPYAVSSVTDSFMMSFIEAASRSPHFQRMLDPSAYFARHQPENDVQRRISERGWPAIGPSEFYRGIEESGVRLCDALVGDGGLTFASALVDDDGRVHDRETAAKHDPGYGRNGMRAVVAQEHVNIITSLAMRKLILARRAPSGEQSRIARKRIDQCLDLAIRFYDSKTDDGRRLPGEYLSGGEGRQHDALAAARFLDAMAMLGRGYEARNTLSAMLAQGEFNNPAPIDLIRHGVDYKSGMFLENRVYSARDLEGTFEETDAHFRMGEARMKKGGLWN